jgi:hypothetical protein
MIAPTRNEGRWRDGSSRSRRVPFGAALNVYGYDSWTVEGQTDDLELRVAEAIKSGKAGVRSCALPTDFRYTDDFISGGAQQGDLVGVRRRRARARGGSGRASPRARQGVPPATLP